MGRRMHRTWQAPAIAAAMAIAATLGLGGIAPARAQDPGSSTPVAGGCTVEPRTPREVAVIAGTPPAAAQSVFELPVVDDATPTPRKPAREPKGPGVPLEIVLPEGPPPPDNAVAGMTATMEQFAACYSAGESLRMMALVTDEYLKGGFAGRALSVQDVVAFAGTPRPMPTAEQRTLAGIRGPRLLQDGRTAALFDLAAVGGAVPGEIRTDFVVFREVGGRWLIDAYASGLPQDTFGPGADS
jgi:hypothetical protein